MSSFLGTDEGENCNTNISSPSFASDSGDKAAACSPTSGCFLHRAAHEASPEEPASDKIVVPVQDRSHSEISDIYATNETDATSEEQPETAEERRIREERESEALAWEMMRQENLEIFRMQMEFMAENREGITDDDYEAIRLAVNESGGIDVLYPNGRAGQLADGENEEYQEEESEEDSQAWDYDRLLELGRTMGDVKTERWRLRASSVINRLPQVEYGEIVKHKEESAKMKSAGTETVGFASCTVGNVTDVEVNIDSKTPYSSGSKRASEGSSKDGSSSKKRKYVLNMVYKERVVDHRCAVCMDSFDSTDLLCLLPCEHYFHVPCTEGWMKDNNSCPTCKLKVSSTPDKM